MRRKSPKTHQEPPGSWTSGTRGRTPLDSPALCPSGIVRGNLNHQASSGAPPPAVPRIDSRECFSDGTEGKNKTDLLTNSKWQIGLFLWLKVARREPERSAASAKRAVTTYQGIPKGAALGAPLVTFPATGKSPGVWGGAPKWWVAVATSSAETPQGGSPLLYAVRQNHQADKTKNPYRQVDGGDHPPALDG